MVSFSRNSRETLLNIYLALGEHPVLAERIRARMLEELFKWGAIQPQAFEFTVRETAINTQKREGFVPILESKESWDFRLVQVRNHLIVHQFSQYFPYTTFESIVNEILGERGMQYENLMLSLNPELAPIETVFEQAMMIERLPATERASYEPRLHESKVVLIRNLISDQLRYINIAKEWFTVSDLAEIQTRRIGSGRIGGKAAGMLLANRILLEAGDEFTSSSCLGTESYYIGSDEFYTFMNVNNLVRWNDQKYKTEDQMRTDFPKILEEFLAGDFPPDIINGLQTMLSTLGNQPLIVRSSSLLEDNFGTSFAGKYDSFFLPNQGTPQENFKALKIAIARVYASAVNPAALLYRQRRGLIDYDERMAILIQVVQGERFGRYYMPHGAGVAFSRNMYRWAPQIRPEDGFVRLVWGLGTRAVDRVGNDYPRLIALSHPLLRPSNEPNAIRRYSQHYIDLIDLEDNQLKTLDIYDVLAPRYFPLRFLAQNDEDGYFVPLHSNLLEGDYKTLVITYDEMLKRTPFAEKMRRILRLLEEKYHSPVDMEFALFLSPGDGGQINVKISILQCRPQSHLKQTDAGHIPTEITRDKIIFASRFVVPRGAVEHVNYVIFVPHEEYYQLKSTDERSALARAIGRLNLALSDESFICVGPGRWGSSNSDLGVPIDYGDIYNSRALVEVAGRGIGLGAEPEPSLGTHFFQDLLEGQIYPLAVCLDYNDTIFNREFFYNTPNHAAEFTKIQDSILNCLRLIKVNDYRADSFIRVLLNDEEGIATAYLEKTETPATPAHSLEAPTPQALVRE